MNCQHGKSFGIGCRCCDNRRRDMINPGTAQSHKAGATLVGQRSEQRVATGTDWGYLALVYAVYCHNQAQAGISEAELDDGPF